MTTTATAKRKSPKILDAPMSAEEFVRSLMPQEQRFMALESGVEELQFLWERAGRLELAQRDATTLSSYMTARLDPAGEPRCSPVLRQQPNPASATQPVRTLWCRVPITLLPISAGKHGQSAYKRIDTASESDALAKLRAAEVPPNVLLHQGDSVVGIWRISVDQAIPTPDVAEIWLQALSRALGAPFGSKTDLLIVPNRAARLSIIPRHEVSARWLGEADGSVSLGELSRWIFPDGIVPGPPETTQESWRRKFLSGVKPY